MHASSPTLTLLHENGHSHSHCHDGRWDSWAVLPVLVLAGSSIGPFSHSSVLLSNLSPLLSNLNLCTVHHPSSIQHHSPLLSTIEQHTATSQRSCDAADSACATQPLSSTASRARLNNNGCAPNYQSRRQSHSTFVSCIQLAHHPSSTVSFHSCTPTYSVPLLPYCRFVQPTLSFLSSTMSTSLLTSSVPSTSSSSSVPPFASVDLTGLVCLVTGGSSGLGEACARLIGRRGAQVVIAARSSEAGERVVSLIEGVQRPQHRPAVPFYAGRATGDGRSAGSLLVGRSVRSVHRQPVQCVCSHRTAWYGTVDQQVRRAGSESCGSAGLCEAGHSSECSESGCDR